ncbi:MAG: VLRF1 family aeRF1-type release factor [Rubrobacteraceae bacterium]
MAQEQNLRQAAGSVADRQGPLLSAYLSVSAAVPENQERAYLVRLREAMDEQGVPEDLQLKVRDSLEGETHPGAKTLAVFASGDDFFEVYRVQLDLPEAVRWGEPYVAPLLLALDEHESYGVALVDAENFRFFVASPVADPSEDAGNVSGSGYRELDFSPSTPGPRGGMDQDPISRRTEANIHQFYNELGELTRDTAFREGIKRIIVAGPKERTAEFREQLPQEVKERVVAEEQVDLDAPEGEILERLEAVREQAEHGRKGDLISEIRESGVWGLDDTVSALQEENRIHHLVLLWELDSEVRWCDNDQLAIPNVTQEECPYCGQQTRVRDLTDVMVDLAAGRGARVEFMRGENENTDALRDEFGGLAGLTRF